MGSSSRLPQRTYFISCACAGDNTECGHIQYELRNLKGGGILRIIPARNLVHYVKKGFTFKFSSIES